MTDIATGEPLPLGRALGRYWWLFLLRGLAAVAFGVLALIWPGITLLSLVFLWGFFAILDGVFALAAAIMGKSAAPRWWLAVVGVAGLGAGVLAFIWPGLTALVLLMFIAAWAIVGGVFQIVGAIQLRKEISNEWLLVLDGALSVLFGIVLVAMPSAGALALVWLIGIFAILFGVLMLGFAFRLRKHAR